MKAHCNNTQTLRMLVSDRGEMSISELTLNISKLEHPCWCNHPHSKYINPYTFYLHTYKSEDNQYTPHAPDDDLKKALGQWVNWHLFQDFRNQLPVSYINKEPCDICRNERENLRPLIIDALIDFQEKNQIQFLTSYSRTPEKLIKSNDLHQTYTHLLITKENLIDFCKLKNIEVTYKASYITKFNPYDPFSNKNITKQIKSLIDEFKQRILERNPNKCRRYINEEKLNQHFQNAGYNKISKFTIKSAIHLYRANGKWPSPKAVYNLMLDIISSFKNNHEQFQIIYSDFEDEINRINTDDFDGESIPVESLRSKRDSPYTMKACTICLDRFKNGILPTILIS